MQASHAIPQLLNRLWHHINPRRRKQFMLLLVLMFFASFAEILSIGAVLPFLGALTAPVRVFEHPLALPIINALGLTTPEQLLFPMTIAFGMAALIAGAMRLLLLWATIRLSFATGADLSLNIYRRTLYQPYAVHVARNSSEIINGISNKTGGVINIIKMLLSLLSSGVMLFIILIAMLSVAPVIALASVGGFGVIYGIISTVTRNRQLLNSQLVARESTQVLKLLQEGLGGIRDILIDGSQNLYCHIYRKADLSLRRAQGNSTFLSASPRFGMEGLGMALIATLAYLHVRKSDEISEAIAVLGALALGAQRLLPILQQAYSSWSNILSGQASLQDALDLLDQPLPYHADQPAIEILQYEQQICLTQISFRYSPATPWVLKKINLNITKGGRVGFIGTTGSGKSTLLDIIMGLLQPTEGMMSIDNHPITIDNHRAWQQHIAHVPQAIFLSDGTIEENIAFGVASAEIDSERVRQAARQAQIADIIETWPNQYHTLIGERGIRLSGGQRQRIGIARALYKQADVIIFDEATSALDNETEWAVMQAIEGLSERLTILIIAHRLSTLKSCTQIVEMGGGGIKRVGTYQEIVNQMA